MKLLTILSFMSVLAFAVTETSYDQALRETVTPFFERGVQGSLEGVEGLNVHYRVFRREGERGSVVFVPGFSETVLKYPELIYDLWNAGYSVYTVDLRGMGLSGRSLTNRQIVHVENFHHYADDLERFVDRVVPAGASDRRYIMTHSTGGWVAAQLMARRPNLFRAAVLAAPLFELATGSVPRFVAHNLASAAVSAGRGSHYATGYGDFNLETYRFQGNTNTHSDVRFAAYRAVLAATPAIQMGGPSFQWLKLALEATATAVIEPLSPRVTTPVLLLQAGQDSWVRAGGQNLFCRRAQRCEKQVFAGAYHEILRETDDIRDEALSAAFSFMGRN